MRKSKRKVRNRRTIIHLNINPKPQQSTEEPSSLTAQCLLYIINNVYPHVKNNRRWVWYAVIAIIIFMCIVFINLDLTEAYKKDALEIAQMLIYETGKVLLYFFGIIFAIMAILS